MSLNSMENELLAEFIGMQKTDIGWYDNEDALIKIHDKYGGNTFDFLEFDTSWDWLMPVLEKIEYELPNDSVVTIEYKDCIIPVEEDLEIEVTGANSKLEAVYLAVLEYVKSYN